MPHISVPAAELNTRLDRLRCAMTEKDPAWSMLLLDNTLDMYYFTGTMQDGALVVTPDQATLFVRRSFDVAKDESAFADIRPMGSFRGIKEVYPDIPETVYVAAKTMTLQKLSMLNKHLPFAPKPADSVLSGLRSVKSAYELDCMRESGRLHRYVIEGLAVSHRAGQSLRLHRHLDCNEVHRLVRAQAARRRHRPAGHSVRLARLPYR